MFEMHYIHSPNTPIFVIIKDNLFKFSGNVYASSFQLSKYPNFDYYTHKVPFTDPDPFFHETNCKKKC